jgi:hypothetical protein
MNVDATSLDLAKTGIEIIGGGSALAAIILKMGRMAGTFEQISQQQTEEIGEIKVEVKRLSEVVTLVAVQKAELAGLREQMALLMKWYDDLRRGNGFIHKGGGGDVG